MPLKLKKSEGSGANHRMPLLPDDEYLPGKIVDIEVVDVDTKFGPKKKARFVIELKGHYDPFSEGGKEPRRVSVKCNLPEKGRGVHEKSNMFKFVNTVLGRDPWESEEDFDIESLARKKMPIRVMMTTSEAQEQTILNDEGEEETVDDYQFQYVTSYRGPKGTKKEEAEADAEDEADEEEAEEAPKSKKAKKRDVASKGDTEEEDDEEEAEEEEDEEEEEEEPEEKPAKKAKVKEGKPAKAKQKELTEEDADDEEGEDLTLDAKILKPLVAGLKKKASNEAGKAKVKEVMKSLGIKAMSDLSAISEDKARKIAKRLGIELPTEDEDDDEKLSFLNG